MRKLLVIVVVMIGVGNVWALDERGVRTAFISFESVDLLKGEVIDVQGKLKIPRTAREGRAVLILHGSNGVDARGDYYARALNVRGIITLEIDMWQPRNVTGVSDRPPLPYFTYNDMFDALAFLAEYPGINPERIGVIGFSWGGVMTMAGMTNRYNTEFNSQYRFASAVANYPVCYAYNNLPFPGVQFSDLIGAPLLIQIGTDDDYDLSEQPCLDLVGSLAPEEQAHVSVNIYPDSEHAFDRLLVPTSVFDPFGYLGQGGIVDLHPNVEQAEASRTRVVNFFMGNL